MASYQLPFRELAGSGGKAAKLAAPYLLHLLRILVVLVVQVTTQYPNGEMKPLRAKHPCTLAKTLYPVHAWLGTGKALLIPIKWARSVAYVCVMKKRWVIYETARPRCAERRYLATCAGEWTAATGSFCFKEHVLNPLMLKSSSNSCRLDLRYLWQ